MFPILLALTPRWHWFTWILLVPVAAAAEVAGNDVVLAQNGYMTLTRADYETALVKLVPEERRPDFASNPKLIDGLLNTLLVRKTLAAQAREAGLDREPIAPNADAYTVLSERMHARLDAEVRVDFDRRIEGFTARAREDYLVNRRHYVTPEEVEFSQVFVESAKRGDEAALAIANKVRAELSNGVDFAALAKEYSDDAASAANGGRMKWTSRAGLDPALAGTLFAMKDTGAVSEAIRAGKGYYVVRLDGRRPPRQRTFDEVKDELLTRLKHSQVDAARKARIEAVIADPGLRVNQQAVDALLTQTDPEAIRRALQAVPSGTAPK